MYLKKILILMLVCLLVLPMTFGLETLKPAKLNQEYIIVQTCATCSYVNFSLSNQEGFIFVNQKMVLNGSGIWTYNYTPINNGRYDVTGVGDIDGTATSFATYFEVTPSGQLFGSGQSLSVFGSLLLMILSSFIFLLIAFRSVGSTSRMVFYCFAGIFFIMTILYTVIIMQQTLSGFDNILTGIETFWFVVKIGTWLGLLSLGVIIFLVMLKAWKIKRGLYDE